MLCAKQEELRRKAAATLERIRILTGQQIQALHENNHGRLYALDKEVELTFGEKERTFGALTEHTKEHGC